MFGADGELHQTRFAQPALYSLQVALVDLWRSWGIIPGTVLGHSVGEFAAAYAAGAFDWQTGLHLVIERGRLMQSVRAVGGMVSFATSEQVLRGAIQELGLVLSIAAVNGPASVVVSGEVDLLERLVAALPSIKSKRLATSHAFHSEHMDDILDDFEAAAREASVSKASCRFVSSLSGGVAREGTLTAAYWRRQVREPVRFHAGMKALAAAGCNVFLEVGPSADLLGLARSCVEEPEAQWTPSLRKGRNDWQQLLEAAGTLFVAGCDFGFEQLDRGVYRSRVPLPTYPFQRERHWWGDEVSLGGPANERRVFDGGVEVARAEGVRLVADAPDSLEGPSDLSDRSRHYIRAALIELAGGADGDTSEHDLLASGRVQPRYEQLLHRWTRRLEASGELLRRGARFTLLPPAHVSAPRGRGRGALSELLERTGPELAAVASGRVGPHEVLFAGGSTALVEAVYAEMPLLKRMNGVLGAAVGGMLRALPAGVRLRVLEVGAGTGSTTRQVLPFLSSANAEFVFSDVSPVLLRRAAEAFGSGSFIRYQTLNLDASPSSQGFDYQSFDLIIASNVLHATPDLVRTLEHLRWLLASSGTLMVMETNGGSVFDATFSLLMTPHHDVALRGPDPLLEAKAWARLLSAQGFAPVEIVPDLGSQSDGPGTFLLLARGPVALRPARIEAATQSPVLLGRALHPLLGARIPSPLVLFQSQVSLDQQSWLRDHAVKGVAILPGAAFIDMALRAAREAPPGHGRALEDLVITRPLAFPRGDERPTLQTLIQGESLEIYSSAEGEWLKHVSARLGATHAHTRSVESLAVLRARMTTDIDVQALYDRFLSRGFAYGPTFRGILTARRGEREGLAELDVPQTDPHDAFDIHPALLDAAFQLVGALRSSREGEAFVPAAVDRVERTGDAAGPLFCYAALREETAHGISADLVLFDGREQPVLQLTGLHLRRLRQGAFGGPAAPVWTHEIRWSPRQRGSARAVPVRTGRWIVIADRAFPTEHLTSLLAASGSFEGIDRVAVDAPGADVRPGVAVDATRPEQFVRAFEKLGGPGLTRCRGVIHLASLDPMGGPAPALASELDRSCVSALHVAQALIELGGDTPPPLWILTSGAVRTSAAQAVVVPTQGAVWALGGVITAERPELACVRIDLDPAAMQDAVALAVENILAPDAENQIAVRSGSRLTPRLLPVPSEEPEDQDRCRGIEQTAPGLLESLRLGDLPRRSPGPGQLEVQVSAAGMQFRDVLIALGHYPEAGSMGSDYAGVVVAIGVGVEGFAMGDAVFGLDSSAFRTHIIVDATSVLALPAQLSVEQAATLPSAFLTAHFALERLAKLGAGERVLIHAATGGVGLAAVQLAQRLGAEVLATAGSEEKRQLLRSLGIKHVFNSRSLEFVEGVREATRGRGVDVVLNSLNGEFIPAGLDVLSEGGRFIELGKRDAWTEESVTRRQPGRRYHRFALDHLRAEQPAEVITALRELVRRFEGGELHPLPIKAFPAADVEAAFRFMQRAQHVGKIALLFDRTWRLRQNAAYLVTGGLRGIGLLIARRLVERGARHLALVGRTRPDEAAEQVIAALREAGASVHVSTCDISREADVQDLWATLRKEMPPLAGIVHAAGVLNDASLPRQSRATLANTFASKVFGTWHLHQQSLGTPLDFFLLLSSQASVLTPPGQANHAAACGFEDAFAHYRAAQGLSATSINSGAWRDTGVATNAEVQKRLQRSGFGAIANEAGVDHIERIMAARHVQVTMGSVDWTAFARSEVVRAAWPIFAEIVPRQVAAGPEVAPPPATVRRSPRGDELKAIVAEAVAKVLGTPVARIAVDRPLSEQGFDSLMNVELRNILQRSVGSDVSLPATLTFHHPSLKAITTFIAQQLSAGRAASTPGCLVQVRAGNGPPIVLVHPGTGGIDCYLQLAEAWQTPRPLLALQSQGLIPDMPMHQTVEQMSMHYRSLLREAGVTSASIVGWSMGGVVALDMASDTSSSGPSFDRTIIIDTIAPAALTAPPSSWHIVAVFATQLRRLPVNALPKSPPAHVQAEEYLAFAIALLDGEKARPLDDVTLRGYRVCEANWRAYLACKPRSISRGVSLILAGDPWYARALGCTSELLGWEIERARARLAPGDHFELFSKSGIDGLVVALEKAFQDGTR
jgi:acyl transferase domain-containing protein/NADPH:quinone reductase-like Zn-dependent oxidoreductase/thioesterase domain-containing protein/short-subunit dehydrogenase